MNYNEALKELSKHGQEHVLEFYKTLPEGEKEELLSCIEEINFDIIDIFREGKKSEDGVITPCETLKLDEIKEREFFYREAGTASIQRGELALVMLAGGQGTRLGFDGPKGTYNIGVTKDLYIFECLINNIMDVVRQTGRFIDLYIMTSDKNYDDTTVFFKAHDYFGYSEKHIHFFKQEMLPSVDENGKILMESPSKICMSPNGNGGWFSSLERAGYVDKLKEDKVKYINVFSVDNVLQRIADPVALGAMLTEDYNSCAKVVKKADPSEKVGVICNRNGKPHIVEYYELTDEMRNEIDSNGNYAYYYGVILNYIFPVDKLMTLLHENMPVHAVKKAIPHIDENGRFIKPESPNGYKFETLALDMLEFMDDCLPYEVMREYEFAPIKNASGVDSPDSARELLIKNGYEV